MFLSVALHEVIFLAGLKFFTLNDYSIQFVFYFIFINLQIALAFLAAAMFSNVKTASGLILAIYFIHCKTINLNTEEELTNKHAITELMIQL
jgi:hypothetical protein